MRDPVEDFKDRLASLMSRGGISEEDQTASNTLLLSCAAGEAYAMEILETRIRASPAYFALGQVALDTLRRDRENSWEKRLTWLQHSGIPSLRGERSVQTFQILIEVRNTLLHGSGEMTTRQADSVRKFIALKKRINSLPGVQADGRRLVLQGAFRDEWVSIAMNFVEHLSYQHQENRS
ncbi:hypothetical protein [Serinicoccus sp. CUA-874]|uniref:hypothetical protein n=1 Tax=Serinicoccus sp. CUA-874 TaxID=1517939 RepID=UPI00117AF73B|nr:hypothetical protein [Serinicoccus sp. CUA-874]